MFVVGILCPLLVPLVTQSDLSTRWKTILSTALVAGLPEVGMLVAVAILGKDGFMELKQRALSLLRRHTAPSRVSRTRYRIGLVMFFGPGLFGFLAPYLVHYFPSLAVTSLRPVIVSDIVFAASFFVLGAGFWEKIHALFVHEPGPVAARDNPGEDHD